MVKNNNGCFLDKIFGKNNKEKKIDIINNDNYIEWLIMFTNRYPAWRDDAQKFGLYDISKEDIKNIKNLYLFYEIIDSYAKKNYFKQHSFANELYYVVRINNYRYRIGVINDQERCFYCQKEIRKEEELINFDDIRVNKEYEKNDRIDYIEETMELEDLLFGLYKRNVPIDVIENTTERVIKKIKIK